jgi:dienelactone hydrolase
VRVPGLVAPNDTAHLKVYYPAAPTNSPEERNTGSLAAATEGMPYPVVILLPGINVGPEGLGWLAQRLSATGMIVVSYALIGEEFPGLVSLTPGLDVQALTPAAFGTRPSSLALGPILADLEACNQAGILAGRIDVSRVVLGGHSAGGTVALLNANPVWFKGVIGCFAYAAHTAAATMLGHPEGTMSPIDPRVPVLIMGGSADGVIAESASRYGDPPGDTMGRVVATFERSISRNKGDCVLAILKGANHFSIAEPKDPTTGRPFLDQEETLEGAHDLIGDIVEAFIADLLEQTATSHVEAVAQARVSNLTLYKRR